MQRASQIIGNISSASKRRKSDDPLIDAEQIACAAWARSVGKKIAQHTRAAKLVRGRLVVEVEDAVWQRNLFTLTKHITSNLEKSLGTGIVTDIEFRIMPPRREPQRATASLVCDESDLIADPGMRRLYRAARQREIA
jgi:predicted nucleic acid-binding Zn ribbon protein